MKHRAFILRLSLISVLFLGSIVEAVAQYNFFDIVPVNGKYSFSYNQVPDNLVPVYPNPAGFVTYVWESSLTPSFETFQVVGSNNAVYTFPGALIQTTYFRRKTVYTQSFTYISNVVKIEVVSANWENLIYVREHDVLIPGLIDWKAIDQLAIGDKLQSTTYLDGLGRPIQKVNREIATPDASQPNGPWGDIVQFSKYDLLGQEPKTFLLYSTSSQSGKFKSDPESDLTAYYSNNYAESSPFSRNTFENNPVSRVVNVKSPGTSWAASQGNSAEYDLNEAAENVKEFGIGYNAGDAPVVIRTYAANQLFKNISIDENGKKTIHYSNSLGQLILKKIQLDDNPTNEHAGWICTYSVYDEFGLLRCQIQPEAVKWLDANGWSFSGIEGQKVFNELCFRYGYDEKGRTIRKKAPGAEELIMLYDQRDRVVFMQDGNQRAKATPEWIAHLYDGLDRTVITTLYQTTKSVSTLQADINNSVVVNNITVINPGSPVNDLVINIRDISISRYAARTSIEFVSDANGSFESASGDEFTAEIDPNAGSSTITVGVTTYNNPITQSELNNSSVTTILKYFFYDNYSYSTVKPFNSNFDNGLAYTNGDPIVTSMRTTNMATGSMVRVLGSTTFLSASIYYDEKGRAIQVLEDNIKSGLDITTLQYQFDGRLLSSNTKHTAGSTGYNNFSIVTKNIFDRIGRVERIEKKIGANAFKPIAAYEYDDMSRLKVRRLDPGYTGSGKNELESLAYTYNIQNQIIGINKDYALKTPGKYDKWGNFFGLYLGFDNRDGVFANQKLNGQVTGTLWTTQGDDAQRKYDFIYDNAGRLSNADFNQKEKPSDTWNHSQIDFSVSGRNGKIEYDLNGNLLFMLQKGVLPGTASPISVDDLQYIYGTGLTNKLSKVEDANPLTVTNGKLGDFVDGSNSGIDDYIFDNNGNLVIDRNKNATDLNGSGTNGIKYNYLDKPEEIRIVGKGTIRIVYDADGNKLQRLFTPDGSTATKTVSYINSFVYEGDNLQYINFEEGRIRVMQAMSQNNGYDFLSLDGNIDLPNNKRGAYDYFIRDYQENVRMILTEETHIGSNQCTMETVRAANEETLFGQVDANGNPTANNEVRARFPVANIPGQASGGGWTNGAIGNHVSRIGNLAGNRIGPNVLLKVMAGDKVSASSIYYYQNPVTNVAGGPSFVSDLLLSLTQAISGSSVTNSLTKGAAGNITSQLSGPGPFRSATDPHADDATGNNPKAYLAVMFFDERFKFVNEGSISLRVLQSGNGASPLILANIKAPKNGYAYVYVANESDEMVYFDNLQVTQDHHRILEENHYYAYGLRIAGISSHKLPDQSEGSVDNKYLYNDKELIDAADLNWYDYGFRNYDPQIGRFTQLDPLTDEYSILTPYQYASNDPITNIDIDGLEGGDGTMAPVYVVAYKATKAGAAIDPKWAARLALIAARGSADALLNANMVGVYDLCGGNHLKEYSDPYEQEAYLQGRLVGDAIAMAQAVGQIEAGGGTAALGLATGPGALVVSTGGAMVALHGAGAGGVATADMAWTMKKLLAVQNTIRAYTDASTSTTQTPPKNGETPSTQTGRDAHKKYNPPNEPGSQYTVDRRSNKLENDKIPDAIDIEKGIVRELKPNNPRKIREGEIQVKDYLKQLQKQYPNKKWKWALDTYEEAGNGTYIYKYGPLN